MCALYQLDHYQILNQQCYQHIQMQVQYRNCNYIGEFDYQLYQRNGYGLLIMDNSHIVMAKWKQNLINGPFVIITQRMRSLGTMKNNKLEGYNIISIQQSLISNKKQKQRTIYGTFRENKLYGKALVIDGDQVIIAHYTDGKLRQITQKKPIRDRQVLDMLQICFPNEIYAIADWLTHIFKKATQQYNADGTYRFEPIHRTFQDDLHFYGYSQIYSKSKATGFLLNQGEVLSIGEHQKDYLQGLGRAYYNDGTVEDGVFKQGQLCGIGISYSKKNHKYILGEHNSEQNQSFQKGFGFPQKQIHEIRRQFHLRSIYFYNDIVLINFCIHFEAITANCLLFNQQVESPRFSSISNNIYYEQKRHGLPQKSPIRAKIKQYEEQSEQIDEPSPIKNRPFNQYQRIDNRMSKYFDNKNPVESQIQRQRQGQRINSRTKQQIPRSKQSRGESKSRTQNRKIKDTKQLVKQLDQKQRTKRGYLDQIYRQAKIYSKRNP